MSVVNGMLKRSNSKRVQPSSMLPPPYRWKIAMRGLRSAYAAVVTGAFRAVNVDPRLHRDARDVAASYDEVAGAQAAVG